MIHAHLTVQHLELTGYMHCTTVNETVQQSVYLVNFSEPVQYVIYMPWLSFDLKCESGTHVYIFVWYHWIRNHEELAKNIPLQHLRSKETTGLYFTYCPDHRVISRYHPVIN